MRAVVVRRYRDRVTKALQPVGAVIIDMDEDRFAELSAAGFVVPANSPAGQPEPGAGPEPEAEQEAEQGAGPKKKKKAK
jgi:hypothetical protein